MLYLDQLSCFQSLHQMTIFLHEPFANLRDEKDVSANIMLAASQAVANMVLAVASTRLDPILIVQSSFGLYTAGQTLSKFYKNRVEHGVTGFGSEEKLRGEIDVLRQLFAAHSQR